MNEDALKRLMQRKRPSVPPRTDELEPNPVVVKSGQSVAIADETPGYTDAGVSTGVDVNMSTQHDETDLPQLVRTTTRLEEHIDKSLRHLCMDEKVTKEVWFEAAYLYLMDHPKAMKAVNGLAKKRYQRRKRAADLRKLETMQKRLRG